MPWPPHPYSACHTLNISGFPAHSDHNDANGIYELFVDFPFESYERCGYNPLYVRLLGSKVYALLSLRTTLTNVQFWTIIQLEHMDSASLYDTLETINREVIFLLAVPNGNTWLRSSIFQNSVYAATLEYQYTVEVWDVQELNGNAHRGAFINPSYDITFSCCLSVVSCWLHA